MIAQHASLTCRLWLLLGALHGLPLLLLLLIWLLLPCRLLLLVQIHVRCCLGIGCCPHQGEQAFLIGDAHLQGHKQSRARFQAYMSNPLCAAVV